MPNINRRLEAHDAIERQYGVLTGTPGLPAMGDQGARPGLSAADEAKYGAQMERAFSAVMRETKQLAESAPGKRITTTVVKPWHRRKMAVAAAAGVAGAVAAPVYKHAKRVHEKAAG